MRQGRTETKPHGDNATETAETPHTRCVKNQERQDAPKSQKAGPDYEDCALTGSAQNTTIRSISDVGLLLPCAGVTTVHKPMRLRR